MGYSVIQNRFSPSNGVPDHDSSHGTPEWIQAFYPNKLLHSGTLYKELLYFGYIQFKSQAGK
jgi:hypothetical protein